MADKVDIYHYPDYDTRNEGTKEGGKLVGTAESAAEFVSKVENVPRGPLNYFAGDKLFKSYDAVMLHFGAVYDGIQKRWCYEGDGF
jgi:hypothetical protein